jgi:hypothetical protein
MGSKQSFWQIFSYEKFRTISETKFVTICGLTSVSVKLRREQCNYRVFKSREYGLVFCTICTLFLVGILKERFTNLWDTARRSIALVRFY